MVRFAALCLVAIAPHARADSPDAGVRVYRDVLKSTVWIHSPRGGALATGSGALIDRRRHLVLTNYHVVGDGDRVTVYFPAYRDGRPVAEKAYYQQRAGQLGIPGRVVARDRKADLALVQIARVPPGAQALPLAPAPVAPGQTVHSIGNPGRSDALWVYTPGKVRQVYHKRWRAKLDDRIAQFDAEVVETDSPTNPGDSGGPLVNDKGELVAVTEGGAIDAQLLSTFIDVSEVHRLLATRDVRAIPTIDADAARPSQAGITDDGNFFSPEALERARQEIARIAHRSGRDVRIETYPSVPDADRERVRGLTGDERTAYFREWAQRRAHSQSINGVTILICRDPSYLYVNVAEAARGVITPEEERRVREALLSQFRDRRYDAGLDAALRLIREALANQRPE